MLYKYILRLPETFPDKTLGVPHTSRPVIAMTDMERSRLLRETLALLKVLECQCVGACTNQNNLPTPYWQTEGLDVFYMKGKNNVMHVSHGRTQMEEFNLKPGLTDIMFTRRGILYLTVL